VGNIVGSNLQPALCRIGECLPRTVLPTTGVEEKLAEAVLDLAEVHAAG
jgi:hypothetical protein